MKAKADEKGKERPKVLQKSAEEECEYMKVQSLFFNKPIFYRLISRTCILPRNNAASSI